MEPSTHHAPPTERLSTWDWARQNLFSSPLNTLLTLMGVALFFVTVPPLVQWAVLTADVHGSTRAACTDAGACWVFVKVHLPQFIYGLYPQPQRWRIDLALGLAIVLAVPLFTRRMPHRPLYGLALYIAYPVIAYVLFHGGWFGLPVVETSRWGGFSLTLVIAGVGIGAALPLGVLLALGRDSELPIVKAVCSIFIEVMRGVPLITVLFMAAFMLPLFLPEGVNFDKLLRALVGVALFAGAYMAEVIRGGLAAVPKGQYEAAQALGLGYWRRTLLIVLPQALKTVIPGIVNIFIALFKDTTLVLIIGLFDLLGMVQNANTDPNWLGYATEGYVFTAAVFWVFCYGMSMLSRRIERSLNRRHAR